MASERMDIGNCEDGLQVALHRDRYDFVLSRLSPNQSVLEIGTGLGAFTTELLPKCGSYIGVEFDPIACRESQRRNSSAQIIKADARQLPFGDNQFSFIVCLEVLEHLGDYQAGVKNIHRCLRADGTVIISVPWRRIGGKSKINEFHLYEPGEQELISLLGQFFSKIETYYQYFEETSWMTAARKLHLRGLLGLAGPYADLSRGLPAATSHLRIESVARGMKLGLILVASSKKERQKITFD